MKIGPVCRLIFCKEGGLIKEFYIIGFKNKNEIRLMMFEEKKPKMRKIHLLSDPTHGY